MPFCPKCKTEYNEGIEICTDCGEKLIQELEKPQQPDNPWVDDHEAFLVSVNSGFSAAITEGSLKSAGIPYLRKGHGGPGGFVRFDSNYSSLGEDFYVPSKLLERARQSLPPVGNEPAEIGDEENPTQEIEGANENNAQNGEVPAPAGGLSRVAIIVGFIALVAVVIYGVDFAMNIIRALLGYR